MPAAGHGDGVGVTEQNQYHFIHIKRKNVSRKISPLRGNENI